MARLSSVCAECGGIYQAGGQSAYCEDCRPKPLNDIPRPKVSAVKRGYDWSWRKLSKRARELQPFCSDCYSPEDLTADHTVEAWERIAAGKTIGLEHVDVVCRTCNTDRGAARGDNIPQHRLEVDSELKARREMFDELFLED